MCTIRSRGSRPSFAACAATENAPVITACDAMMVAAVASSTIGSRAQLGDEQEERCTDGLLVADDQRALTEVVEHARGQDDEEPRQRDRPSTEVAHVGVERLGAGDGEDDRGQREERNVEVPEDERQRVGRRQRLEDLRVVDDAPDAEGADRDEPQDHHRPEEAADLGRAVALNHEQGTR